MKSKYLRMPGNYLNEGKSFTSYYLEQSISGEVKVYDGNKQFMFSCNGITELQSCIRDLSHMVGKDMTDIDILTHEEATVCIA